MTAVGDSVCYTGYVMDSYCINRGELLDMPGKKTLLHPKLHSLHCLLDPPQCTPRGGATYELLALRARDDQGGGAAAAADGSNGPHGRAYGLDDTGSRAMLKFARAAGRATSAGGGCTTCTNSSAAAPSAGFVATVTGTIADAAAAPTVLTNVSVHHGSTSCFTLTGSNDTVPSGGLDYASGALYKCVAGQCKLMPGGVTKSTCSAACHPSAAAITVDLKIWGDASCSGTPSLDDKFRNVGATCSAGDGTFGGSLEYTGSSCTSGGKLSVYDSNDCTGAFHTIDVSAGESVQPCSPGEDGFHELSCSGGTPATGATASGLPLGLGLGLGLPAAAAIVALSLRKRSGAAAGAGARDGAAVAGAAPEMEMGVNPGVDAVNAL